MLQGHSVAPGLLYCTCGADWRAGAHGDRNTPRGGGVRACARGGDGTRDADGGTYRVLVERGGGGGPSTEEACQSPGTCFRWYSFYSSNSGYQYKFPYPAQASLPGRRGHRQPASPSLCWRVTRPIKLALPFIHAFIPLLHIHVHVHVT